MVDWTSQAGDASLPSGGTVLYFGNGEEKTKRERPKRICIAVKIEMAFSNVKRGHEL